MNRLHNPSANIASKNPAGSTTVDFRQPDDSTRIFAQPPQLSSHRSKWSGLHVEYFANHPAWTTVEHTMPIPTVSLVLTDDVQSRRLLDGQFQQECQRVGTVALFPAQITHKCEWNHPVNFMALSIEPSYLSNILKSEINAERIDLIPTFATQQDDLILAIGLALKAELETGGALGQLYVDSLTTTLCVHLLRHYATRSPQLPIHKGGLSRDRLRRTLDLIHTSLDQSLRLETLAAAVDLDMYYFSRLFRQSMGISPYQYVLQQRIEKAKSLLQDEALTITDIALECGFTDSSHLARQFRKAVGTSPGEYRQQMQ